MTEEKIIEGIIIDVDYGFGMKFVDLENMYLRLEIQQFDGHSCIQLFDQEAIGKILLQFKGEYRGELSLKTLLHRIVFLSPHTTNGVPDAIAKMPPSEYPQYTWIKNSNW